MTTVRRAYLRYFPQSSLMLEKEREGKKNDQKNTEVWKIPPSLSFREHLSQKAKSRAMGGEEDMAVNHMSQSPAPLIRKVNNKES